MTDCLQAAGTVFVAVLYRGRCSLPLAVEEVTIGRLGLMMAGSSFAEAADAA